MTEDHSMQTLIVYVDDVDHALHQLPQARGEDGGARRWVLIGCPPRVTHHVSPWVTRSARENWRSKWANKLFAQLVPSLGRPGDEVITCIGENNLHAQSEALLREHQQARIVDARRPRGGVKDDPSPAPSLLSLLITSASPAMWAMAE
jgi:hypothetical protein